MSNKATGELGEQLAADFLAEQGYLVLERNYRFERAEVDLICFLPAADYSQGGEIVFVEVKARRSDRFGTPEEAVTEAKKRNIMRAAEAYLHERRLEGSPARFDVVCVTMGQGSPEITHHKYAFGMFF